MPKYYIEGVKSKTGEEITLEVTARDESTALAKAKQMGIFVTLCEIEPVEVPVTFEKPATREGYQSNVEVPSDTASSAKYPSIRFLAGCFKFIAILMFILGFLVGVSFLKSSPEIGTGALLFVISVIVSIMFSISFFALGEFMVLMIDVEYNLRDIRDRLPTPSLTSSKTSS